MKNSSSADRAQERILSIDIYRGFALVVMVVIHFALYFGNEQAAHSMVNFFLDHCLADWGAAAFLMMMGMSQVFSAKRSDKPDNWLLFKKALLRGGYIFAVGLLMLALAWGPDKIWWWDILTLMGFATIVLFACRFLPSWFLVILSAAIMTLTPFIRGALNVAADWEFAENPIMSQLLPGMYCEPLVEYHPEIFKGLFLSGYFPVFPWIAFTIIGFVLGRRVVDRKIRSDLPILVLAGSALVGLGFVLSYAGRALPMESVSNRLISPFCFYPDSFSLTNVQAGVSLVFFSAVYYLFDVRKKDKTKLDFFSRLFIQTSYFSLTFYFLHYMIIGWSLGILYLITGKYMLGDLMGAVPALLCGLAAVALLEILIFYWGKAGARYSLEWFLVGLTRLAVPSYRRSVSTPGARSGKPKP